MVPQSQPRRLTPRAESGENGLVAAAAGRVWLAGVPRKQGLQVVKTQYSTR